MSKKIWGNITWRLFHTMTLYINDGNYDEIQGAIQCIEKICRHLPCPLCSNDAVSNFKKNKFETNKDKGRVKTIYPFFP